MLESLLVVVVAVVAPAAQPPVNTLCPACGGPVNAKHGTVAVRGRTYRVCCVPCGDMLQKVPDKYLLPDGTPKNTKK